METRSSPSLQVLQGLARQAHMDAQNLSTLSKPALFVHLRSNYDYQRLERAHQIALKRSEGGDPELGTGSGNAGGSSSSGGGSNKRVCRAAGPAAAGGTSSPDSFSEEPGLPPASIFVQTRSRSRMLLAGRNAGSDAGRSGSARGSAGNGLASPCVRAQRLKLSGRRSGGSSPGGKGGGGSSSSSSSTSTTITTTTNAATPSSSSSNNNSSSSGGSSSGSSNSSGNNCSSSGSSSNNNRNNVGAGASSAAPAAAESVAGELTPAGLASTGAAACGCGCGAEEGKADCDCQTSDTAENTAKRKAHGGRRSASSSARGGGKGKGKGKAKECGGDNANGGGEGEDSKGWASLDARGEDKVASGSGGGGDGCCGNRKSYEPPPNELDPIMLVKVGKDHYRFVRPNGRVVMYNLDSLVDYFISTGDFLEPETRLPFSDDELRAIDVKAKAAGLSKPSVLEAKRDPGRYTEQKFQQDALVGLERMTSELVTGMLRVVEGCDREEGELCLVTEIFPPFADLFKQIWGADKAFALQCMHHYTSWLQGPPNRPTEDEMGFLDIILGFLRQLQECDGNSSLGF